MTTLLMTLPLMLSPGPANLVSLALAARHGVWRVLKFQAGILTVYVATCIILGAATGQLVQNYATPSMVIQICGGAFIVYLGYRLLKRAFAAPQTKDGENRDSDASETLQPPTFASGVLLQLLNPKFPVVVLTILSAETGLPLVARCTVIVACGILGMLLYSITGALIHGLVKQNRHLRRLDLATGLLLGAVGMWIVMQGVYAWVRWLFFA